MTDGVEKLISEIDERISKAYKVLEGDEDTLYVKERATGIHYQIKVSECNNEWMKSRIGA